jgi:hypothetical protein
VACVIVTFKCERVCSSTSFLSKTRVLMMSALATLTTSVSRPWVQDVNAAHSDLQRDLSPLQHP